MGLKFGKCEGPDSRTRSSAGEEDKHKSKQARVQHRQSLKKAWTMVGTSYLMRLRLPSLLSARNGIISAMHRANLGYARNNNGYDGFLLALNVGHWQRQIHSEKNSMLGTTVLCIRKDHTVVVIGDGQVTIGSEIVKPNVRKVRKIGDNVIGGFAGATADALTLFEKLECQLEEHSGQLTRAAVELAKTWRTDKFLRRLDAVMVVADSDISLTITGNGDVLEPHDGIIAIGSGGPYAIAAARALIDVPNMDAEAIARKAMKIAADCCIYTNHNFTIEKISSTSEDSPVVDSEAVDLFSPDNEHISGSPFSTPAISTSETCTELSKTATENNGDEHPSKA